MANKVTDDQGKIDCPGICSAVYQEGSNITLTPTPDPDYIFDHWEGDTTDGTVHLDSNKSVTAVFVPRYYNIRFRCLSGSTDPVEVLVEYADSNKKFWVDGTEYNSGTTVNVPKDDGSVEHIITVDGREINNFSIRDGVELYSEDFRPLKGLTYFITNYSSIVGDVADLIKSDTQSTNFQHTNADTFNLTAFQNSNVLNSVYLYNTNATGAISDLHHLVDVLTSISNGLNNITVETADLAQFNVITNFYGQGSNWSGDIAGLKNFTSVITFRGHNSTGLTSAEDLDTFMFNAHEINLSNAGLDQAGVDRILRAKVLDCDNGAGSNGYLYLNLNAVPSAQGQADADTLVNTYGWTVVIDTYSRATVSINDKQIYFPNSSKVGFNEFTNEGVHFEPDIDKERINILKQCNVRINLSYVGSSDLYMKIVIDTPEGFEIINEETWEGILDAGTGIYLYGAVSRPGDYQIDSLELVIETK